MGRLAEYFGHTVGLAVQQEDRAAEGLLDVRPFLDGGSALVGKDKIIVVEAQFRRMGVGTGRFSVGGVDQFGGVGQRGKSGKSEHLGLSKVCEPIRFL